MFPKIIPKITYQIITCIAIVAIVSLTIYWQISFSGLFAIIARACADEKGQYGIFIAWSLTCTTLLLALIPFSLILRAFTKQMPPLAQSFRQSFKSPFSLFHLFQKNDNGAQTNLNGLELAKPSSRIWSFIIDRVILIAGIIIFVGLAIPLVDYWRAQPDKQVYNFIVVVGSIAVTLIASYAYIRDIYNGQSIARRLFKIQIISTETKLPIGGWKSFQRELSLHFLPTLIFELVLIFQEDGKRLGDRWAKTVVIKKPE